MGLVPAKNIWLISMQPGTVDCHARKNGLMRRLTSVMSIDRSATKTSDFNPVASCVLLSPGLIVFIRINLCPSCLRLRLLFGACRRFGSYSSTCSGCGSSHHHEHHRRRRDVRSPCLLLLLLRGHLGRPCCLWAVVSRTRSRPRWSDREVLPR